MNNRRYSGRIHFLLNLIKSSCPSSRHLFSCFSTLRLKRSTLSACTRELNIETGKIFFEFESLRLIKTFPILFAVCMAHNIAQKVALKRKKWTFDDSFPSEERKTIKVQASSAAKRYAIKSIFHASLSAFADWYTNKSHYRQTIHAGGNEKCRRESDRARGRRQIDFPEEQNGLFIAQINWMKAFGTKFLCLREESITAFYSS